ncbi:MAG TPA: glycosyltransferase [Candidatus Saccharimonadales bacterium]|jgi:glycosyltransferase involved in cell wall biosynthesis|nr:glycosyltransferase [Candidatus Saccharimonadales bacterium]
MTDRTRPKVSIIAISYNHEKYIRQALDSFINQQTDFSYEIVIGDDHSTDDTVKIIKEYAAKHPDLIKPILRSKNVGIPKNFADTMNHASGEYIALCECDDFWTDQHKLQIQADFLDNNPQDALCFHPVSIVFENKEGKTGTEVFPDKKEFKEFTLVELLRRNFMQTNSVMYRRQTYKDFPLDILPVDWYLHLYHAQFGGIGYIDRVMASYRRHESGVWWANNAEEFWNKNGIKHLAMYRAALKLYGQDKKYKEVLYEPISRAFLAIANLKPSPEHNLLFEAFIKYPDMAAESIRHFLTDNKKIIEDKDKLIESDEAHIKKLETLVNKQNEDMQMANAALNEINDSRAWKLAKGMRKAKSTLTRRSK